MGEIPGGGRNRCSSAIGAGEFCLFPQAVTSAQGVCGICPHFAPCFSIHRPVWVPQGQCPSPFRQRFSPEPSSSFHKRLFSLKNRPTSEEPGRAPRGSDCEHVIHIRLHSVCGLARFSCHGSGTAWIKAFNTPGGDREGVAGGTFA